MFLSIIVPAYNVEKFIERCLTSICDQTYKDFEIIVIDDVSSDNTREILKKYSSLEPRLKLFFQTENRGPAYCRQVGIDNAKGNYITFVDADDWYFNQNLLEELVDIIKKWCPDCIMYGYKTIHPKYSLKRNGKLRTGLYDVEEIAVTKERTRVPYYHYLWNKMYSAKIIKKNQVQFKAELRGSAEDVRFNEDFLAVAKSIYIMNGIGYAYDCCNSSSITHSLEKMPWTKNCAIDNLIQINEYFYRMKKSYKDLNNNKHISYYLARNVYLKYYQILHRERDKEYYNEIKGICNDLNSYKEVVSTLGNTMKLVQIRVKCSGFKMTVFRTIKKVIG